MLRVNRSLQSLELSGNDFGESDLRKLLAALHDLDNPSLWTRKRNITLFELLLLDNHFDGEWMQKVSERCERAFWKTSILAMYCAKWLQT